MAVIILTISAYRVFNIIRAVGGHSKEEYIYHATRRTGIWLIGTQLAAFIIWWIDWSYSVSESLWLWAFLVLDVLIALSLAISTNRHMRTTKLPENNKFLTDAELPTVTVAIPARNEDEQLELCLRSVIASDYPKLEVIVLDDCSQDHTSEIIRKFAHDGVRFVGGDRPRPNWLAKNQAFARLADEASGDIMVFCGVEVRFGTASIRQLVTALKQKNKSMLCVVPQNVQTDISLPQSMRYVWAFAPPRRFFNRPPTISTCWLIDREALKNAGGFSAAAQSIEPEAHFARECIKHDGYSFVRSSTALNLTCTKPWREQFATAVRTRYPQLHRRPELVALISVFELIFLVSPFVLFVAGLWGIFGWPTETVLLAETFMLLAMYAKIILSLFAKNRWWFAVLPVGVVLDVILLNYSMWKYEFSEVLWKGRNVCLPIMQVKRHLPTLNSPLNSSK